MTLKLTNFGKAHLLNTCMPPEILASEREPSPEALIDSQLFSAGLLLLKLVAGPLVPTEKSFFDFLGHEDISQLWRKLEIAQRAFSEQTLTFSDELKSLIEGLLQYEPAKRLNLWGLASHNWLVFEDAKEKVRDKMIFRAAEIQSRGPAT
jgi:serine/threonine protein kinase